MFKITGYGDWFFGEGFYNSSVGVFSGSLYCAPNVYGGMCGAGGKYWCGADAACTYNLAFVQQYFFCDTCIAPVRSVVGVGSLSVNTVAKLW